MIDVISLYEDVTKDQVNTVENGSLSIKRFNRYSRRAELLLIDWLTGDVAGKIPPAPWLTQKNKDWVAPFIKKFPTQVVGGAIARPDDYYTYDNLYRITGDTSDLCEDDDDQDIQLGRKTITILDGDVYNNRIGTWIEELKPTFDVPIAKVMGKTFEFDPADLGSVVLEYARYPVFGNIVPMLDKVFNEEVPDPATSKNYEWDEAVRSILIYAISNMAADTNREQSGKQFNAATGKTFRG